MFDVPLAVFCNTLYCTIILQVTAVSRAMGNWLVVRLFLIIPLSIPASDFQFKVPNGLFFNQL